MMRKQTTEFMAVIMLGVISLLAIPATGQFAGSGGSYTNEYSDADGNWIAHVFTEDGDFVLS